MHQGQQLSMRYTNQPPPPPMVFPKGVGGRAALNNGLGAFAHFGDILATRDWNRMGSFWTNLHC